MRRFLEAFFAHKYKLIALLTVPVLLGGVIALVLPRSYQAFATLWVNEPYTIVGATPSQSSLMETPAASQADALTELLQARTFGLQVAQEADLTSMLSPGDRANADRRDALLMQEVAKVQIAAVGENMVSISYTSTSPRLAQQVVQSVTDNFAAQTKGFSSVQAQKLLNGYNTELAQAKSAANDAVAAETKYLQAHPSLTTADLTTDPQYAYLHAQTQQANATVLSITGRISKLNDDIASNGASADSPFGVVDAPQIPHIATSRTKVIALAVGGGAAVGLLACVVFLVIVMRRTMGIYDARDLARITELPLLGELPDLPAPALATIARSLRDTI